MRFGIMAMQTESLIPTGLSAGEIIAYASAFDHAELVRGLAKCGFKLVELGGDLMLFFPSAYTPPSIERLAALKAELGLSYTVHLPLWSVEPSTPLQSVRQGSLRALLEITKATWPLQPEVYVLHATGSLAAEFYRMKLPELGHALILRQFQAQARATIKALLAETGLPSRRLAVETVEFPLDLTLELAEELNLSVCLDTGHVLAGFSGAWDLFEALERCAPRLAEVHLHDARRPSAGQEVVYGQDHAPLGTGDLELGLLLDRLGERKFGGPVILELKVQEALDSLQVIRAQRPALLPRDA